MIRTLWAWLAGRRPVEAVSEAWSRDQLRAELRAGWEGPRWRTPREIARMRRAERHAVGRLRMVGGR